MTKKNKKQYDAAYYRNNKDTIKANTKTWYNKNKEASKRYIRKWQKANRSKMKQYQRDYYKNLKQRAKKWVALIAALEGQTDRYIVGEIVIGLLQAEKGKE